MVARGRPQDPVGARRPGCRRRGSRVRGEPRRPARVRRCHSRGPAPQRPPPPTALPAAPRQRQASPQLRALRILGLKALLSTLPPVAQASQRRLPALRTLRAAAGGGALLLRARRCPWSRCPDRDLDPALAGWGAGVHAPIARLEP